MNPEPKELVEYKTDHDLLIELRTMMHYMASQLESFNKNFVTREEFAPVKEGYVSQDEFDPIRKLVYGCVTIMLSALILAIVYLVVKH
jgi:hypothetical protein